MTATTQTIQSNERHGIILSLASIGCFSSTALLLSYAGKNYGLDGWVAAAYRGFIGLLCISLVQKSTGKLTLSHIITNRLLFLRGLIGGLAIPIFYISVMEIGAGRAGIITGSYPLFAALFAMILIRENVRWTYSVYITIAMLGLLGIFLDKGIEGGKPFYDILAVIGSGTAGLCVVLIRHLWHTENTSNIFASQCMFTLIIGSAVAGKSLIITDPAALCITLLAAVTVVGGQLCITEAFRHITVAKGSTLQMLTPATTCVCSAFLLGETFGPLEICGGVAILFASYRIANMKGG